MSNLGWPVRIVESGGIPVTEAANGLGAPYVEADNGVAVTFVESGGYPLTTGGQWWRAPKHRLDSASPLAVLSPASGRSMLNGRAVNDNALISRQGGIKYVVGADGVLSAVPANTLAYDWSSGVRELVFEGQATNYLKNAVLAGAALGILGSGGSLPTGFGLSAAIGGDLTAEVTWIGAYLGAAAFDLRLRGQNTTPRFFNLSPTTEVPAATGETRTTSLRIYVVSGSLAGFPDLQLTLSERKSDGANATGSPAASLNLGVDPANTARRTLTRTCTAADCAALLTYIRIPAVTAPIDVTIRVSIPQCEAGSVASSYIPTAGAAVTRLADVAPLWANAGSATAWAYRAVVPTLIAAQGLVGATGGPYLEAGTSDMTLLRIAGRSDNAYGFTGALPGEINCAFGWGTSGRIVANSGSDASLRAEVVDCSRTAMYIGLRAGLVARQVIRLRELVAWQLPDRPSAAGCQAQARLWSA